MNADQIYAALKEGKANAGVQLEAARYIRELEDRLAEVQHMAELSNG